MTAPVIALLVPGARLDQLIDLIHPGFSIGSSPAGAAGRRARCVNTISPASQLAALRP